MALGGEHQAFTVSVEASNVKGIRNPNSTFFTRTGRHELFSPEVRIEQLQELPLIQIEPDKSTRTMWKAAVTELVASSTFLFTLTSAIIAGLESHETDPKLIIPVIVFVIAFLWLLATAPFSGGFLSPAFSFIGALKGIISPVRALFYCFGQFIGAMISTLAMKSVMDNATAHKYSLGGCMVNGNGAGVSTGTALLIEFSCTFMVLYLAMNILSDKKKSQDLGLTMICTIIAGAYAVSVFLSITVTGRTGYSGVGLNPARCLAPALLLGGSLWDGHWVFWIGPMCGCIVYYIFSLMLPKQGFVRADEEQDVMQLFRTNCVGFHDSPRHCEGKF